MLRVLIVDDLADSANTVAALIQIEGHTTRVALRGQEAISEAETFLPHVLLVDLAMPGMGGLEVARRVRALPGMGGVLIVATTGFDGTRLRGQASTVGIEHYLVKPYDTSVLLALLNAYVKEGTTVPDAARPPSWFATKI